MKANANKVRALKGGKILAGFAGASADAFTLFEKFEEKLERYPGNLPRAAVELAKDWRSDRVLRRLEAPLVVADKRSEEHTSELQSRPHPVCRLLLSKKKIVDSPPHTCHPLS